MILLLVSCFRHFPPLEAPNMPVIAAQCPLFGVAFCVAFACVLHVFFLISPRACFVGTGEQNEEGTRVTEGGRTGRGTPRRLGGNGRGPGIR